MNPELKYDVVVAGAGVAVLRLPSPLREGE